MASITTRENASFLFISLAVRFFPLHELRSGRRRFHDAALNTLFLLPLPFATRSPGWRLERVQRRLEPAGQKPGLELRGIEFTPRRASDLTGAASQVQVRTSRVQSGAPKVQIRASRVQTGASRVQVGASRVQIAASQVQVRASRLAVSVGEVYRPAPSHEQGGSVDPVSGYADRSGRRLPRPRQRGGPSVLPALPGRALAHGRDRHGVPARPRTRLRCAVGMGRHERACDPGSRLVEAASASAGRGTSPVWSP